ncbi:MAG TPA: lamin tail domain-containing protein, partial [Pyrinomonadaceae bacterium]|nr:lamin tail domain-containing protein [Pyrinomonadaceae bacterium]
GLATGVGIGTTTITATAPDGLGGTVSDTATLTVQVPLVINEILADPPTGITGDSNRDGTESSTQDEFIELVNNSSAPVDISGVVLSDSTSDRFTFPANTILAANRAVIIFGGGSPPANDPNFGGALVFTAGSLGLNNDGDTVTAKLAVGGTNVQIDQVIYGGANPAPAPTDQSLTRSPDLTGAFIQHTTPTDANGRRFSPGTRLDGTPFGSPPITRIAITPASATVDPNDTQGFTAQAFSNVGGPEVEVQNVSFIWASTNTSVATVSPLTGVSTTATAHASGSATIQARAGGQLGTATLNVNSPPPVLTSVTISPASATIGVGETQQFTAQARDQFGQPFGGVTITFASNNTAVATVVSGSTSGTGSATGTATGQSGGSAEIRATADDGTTSVTSTPATLTVTQVNAGDVVISEFRFRGSNGANDEFIELYNRTSASIVISGYKIYRSNGTGTRTLHKTIANGVTLGAGCHYLLTNSNATGPYNDSVVGDDTYATGITEDGGIAFARPSSDGTTGIIDQVGLSAGSAYKEGTPQTSLGNTTAANIDRSYERKPGGAAGNGQDTDDNLTDFQLINPSDPQNSFSGCINTTSPDLSIVKTDTPDPVDAGANITYTLVVTNNTASVIVPNVTVTDPLPSGTSLVSVGTLPSGWTRTDSVASGGTGTITFKRTNMPGTGADSTATFTITVKVALGTADGTVISNTASVASDLVDSAPGNNSDTETTTVQAPTDLSITKTVNDASPDVGDQVVFTLTLSNNGTDAATGVEVTDQLPSGFTFLSASPAAAYNSTTGVWTVGTVNGGTNSVLTITAEVTQAAASTSGATNTATITASDQPDPVTSNNQSSVTVKALRANLSLTKSDSADPVEPGDALTYTIVVTNHGPNTAEAVKVTDSLPSELTLVSCTAPGGSCTNTGNDIEVNYTSLANGASATVTIETTVSNSTALGTTLSNTATADAATFDGTTSNNTDTETTTVDVPPPPTANLSLLKEVNNEHPSVGQNVTFTISLFNTGPDSATGVEVTDKLPTGLDYVSHSASQGTYNNVTGIWAVGSVGVSNSAAVATLTIVATMNSGFFKINTAEVTASDQADPNSEPNNNDPFEDDQSSVAVTPPQANLELTKTANTTTPNVGQNVTFTLSLKNFGFSNATGVEVTDQLPSGLTFVTASPLAEYNSTTGVWTVGSINNGATRTLTITATVTSPGSKTNTAKVTASDQFDPNTTNNTSSVTVTPPEANLTISKSDTPDPVSVGNNITYTITVTNGGPDTAQNVSVTDSLPAELTFVSCAAPGGSCSNTGNNVTASYASLTNGASATITIVATVNRTVADNTTITNTAQATSATYDPSTPNSATTTTTAKLPLLVISRFYGGSGTTGIYRCDFVEIFNRGVTSVDFTTSNYSLQYAAAAGNVGGTGTAANLHVINTGSIDPGEYYLVQLNCGSTTVGTPVSGADSTGSINPSATDGKLALVIGTTALGVSCPSLPNTNIADFVGYGGASCSETAPTAALSATKVGVRLGDGCTDTDNNSTNFAVNTHNNTTNPAPAPRNNSSPVNNCP